MFKLIPHTHEEFTPTEKYLPHFITNGLFVVVDDIHTDRVLRTDLFSDIFFLTNDATTDRVLHPGSLFGIFSLMNDKCKRRFYLPTTYFDCGSIESPNIDIGLFQTMADKIKNGCSVLLLCDTNIYNAFPFLVYYLTKFVSDEYPTIDKAVGAIFNMIDKRGYFSRFEEISNVMKNCLTDAYN